MTRKIELFYTCVLLLTLALAGCGGSSRSPQAGTNTVASQDAQPVFAFLQDSPSDNIVAFRIDTTGAGLTTTAGANVSISSNVQHLEIRHLDLAPTLAFQTNSALFTTYASLHISFASPQITLADDQGKVTQLDGSTFPSVRLLNDTVTIPLAPSNSGILGIMLDFNLQQSITVDKDGNYLVDPVIIPTLISPIDNHSELQSARGRILNLASGNAAMDVQLDTGIVVHLVTDPSTSIQAINGARLAPGQSIDVTAHLQSDGSFLARYITPTTNTPSSSYSGVVTTVHPQGSNYIVDVATQN